VTGFLFIFKLFIFKKVGNLSLTISCVL
jgi:hypothetical protein